MFSSWLLVSKFENDLISVTSKQDDTSLLHKEQVYRVGYVHLGYRPNRGWDPCCLVKIQTCQPPLCAQGSENIE